MRNNKAMKDRRRPIAVFDCGFDFSDFLLFLTPMHEFSTWTVTEANAIIPLLSHLTNSAQARLDALDEIWGALSLQKFDAIRGIAEGDMIRTRWALRVAALGAIPVGFFVVDFPTTDPEVVLCWRQGETAIVRERKQETFRYCRRTCAGGVALP
jgi:hypothetical protein